MRPNGISVKANSVNASVVARLVRRVGFLLASEDCGWASIYNLCKLPNLLAVQDSADLFGEAIWIERFAKETIESRFPGLVHLFEAGLRGDCHDGHGSKTICRADFLLRAISVFIRKTNIHQDQVETREGVCIFNNLVP